MSSLKIVIIFFLSFLFISTAHAEYLGYFDGSSLLSKQILSNSGTSIRVNGFPLQKNGIKEVVSLELSPFSIFDKDAKVVVHGSDGQQSLPVPKSSYFSGNIVGRSQDSHVFIRLDDDGSITSIVRDGDDISISSNQHDPAGLVTSRLVKPDEYSNREFSCGVSHDHESNDFFSKFSQSFREYGKIANQPELSDSAVKSGVDQTTYTAKLIIETDYEFYRLFNNASVAAQYVADLLSYVSSLYKKEVGVALALQEVKLYSTPSDPWTKSDSTISALDELQAHYVARYPQVNRTAVHLLSGKDLGGGVAYVGAICINEYNYPNGQAFDFGVSASLEGQFSSANPGIVWDSLVVAHELGHNFGSLHTHAYDEYEAYSQPVDCCAADSSTGYCAVNGFPLFQYLPGVDSLTGGISGTGAGTIMSYCHAVQGGDDNISMVFGSGHDRGIQPGRVPFVMKSLVSEYAGEFPACLVPSTIIPEIPKVSDDFDGDGKSDILWRHGVTGKNVVYFMDGHKLKLASPVNFVADTRWQVVGNGDYDGDGKADILWRHAVTGKNVVYLMNSSQLKLAGQVDVVADPQWQVVGGGDYDGDGKSDIFWRHKTTGKNIIYLMDGIKPKSKGLVNTIADSRWQVVGNGDYNNDGKSDVLWRHNVTGKNYLFLMDGVKVKSASQINIVADARWQVVGSGDYDGDGKDDILWRHATTGSSLMYLMDSFRVKSSSRVDIATSTDWTVVGSGDYDGDGKSDIFLRHRGNGKNYMYLMDGFQPKAQSLVNTVPDQGWSVVSSSKF